MSKRALILPTIVLAFSAWGASVASAEEAIYSATRTIAVPPASNFKTAGGGGDGWAVALSDTDVYNVFHHQTHLTVACHEQSSGASCFSPETITDGEGHGFATSGHPGMYLDPNTGKLYVYATRGNDSTAGVVCVDTTKATTEPNPFCGYTALTPTGQGALQSGISGTSTPMLIGNHWYAFNQVEGAGISGAENELLCFDVGSDTPCAGQPFEVPFGAGNVEDIYPGPPSAALGGEVLVPLLVEGKTRIACFDDTTQQPCTGSWPLELEGVNYAGFNGSPFALLDGKGKLLGFCIPTGADQCFTLAGGHAETPVAMPSVIHANDEWNGPGLVIGPRVYVPNGETSASGDVECFDYATGASCPNFPKEFSGLSYLYTVNADPQRPSCIWVNADSGSEQIQNFDAYSGGTCGTGPVRGLGTQFVANGEQCTPISYISLSVAKPPPSEYTSAEITFTDGDGEPLAGLEELMLDANGSLSLEGLDLFSETGLPQFLFKFNGLKGELSSIEVKLTWRATYAESCGGEGRSVTRLPASEATKPTERTTTSEKTPTAPTVAPIAAPACRLEQLVLTSVDEDGARVRISGAAQPPLAGRTVDIELVATGRTVATATIAADGTFTATAVLPASDVRHTNQVRYRAVVGSAVSSPLKLYRRMFVTRASVVAGGVLLEGHVDGDYTPATPVTVHLYEACGTGRVVGHTKLTKTGMFSVLVPAPSGPAAQAALYRVSSHVLYHDRPMPTWTLPAR